MFIKAINEAIREEMRRDETVIVIGQSVKHSTTGDTVRLFDEFGEGRVIETPISEAAYIGTALGLAISGFRPVVELLNVSYTFLAIDQVLNQVAKMRYRTGGQTKVPIVLLLAYSQLEGGPQFTQALYPVYMHVPGLKLAIPSTPLDAKGLLKTAIRDDNPVAFFHSYALHKMGGFIPEEEYTIPFGQGAVVRQGEDLTIVATGFFVHKAITVAEQLEKEGYSVEVVDPKTLIPLDKKIILDSVRKTRRLIVVDQAHLTCGVASEIAAIVAEEGFSYLKAPIKRVAALDIPLAASRSLRNYLEPSEKEIIKAAKEILV
jgi:pyruvate dehydrogenase E1 component beta subunit